MVIQVVYISTPVGPQPPASFFENNQARNRSIGVSGMIVTSPNLYIQLMEGERATVNRLYNKITRDGRHKDPMILRYIDVKAREFAEWDMMHVSDETMRESPMLANHLPSAILPADMTGVQALAMMRRLAALHKAGLLQPKAA
jgi:hypothetical protein